MIDGLVRQVTTAWWELKFLPLVQGVRTEIKLEDQRKVLVQFVRLEDIAHQALRII